MPQVTLASRVVDQDDIPGVGTALWGGWSVGEPLPALGGLSRRLAKRPDGRRAIVEFARRPTGRAWSALLDGVVDEVEAWSDADGFLRVLAAGRVGDTEWVARIVEGPRGQSLASTLGQPMLPGRVVWLGQVVARALTAAHARALVHGSLSLDRVYVTGDWVEIEPGGFAPLMGGLSRTRGEDLEQLGRILAALLAGHETTALRPEVPLELAQVIRDALSVGQNGRPSADQLWASLRDLNGRYGDLMDATPASASRTIAPRMGEVDVRLPPAPPPAPDIRSIIPVHERRLAPPQPRQVPKAALVAASVMLLLVLTLLALWWW